MTRFINWARTHHSAPASWESPRTAPEIADVLARARRAKQRVRPVGSGHSWSSIAVPEDVALDLTNMRQVVEIDAARRTARVQGGIQLSELNEALDRVGLAVPILGSISAQTITGAISTGTHGSSLVHGNLSSLVEELTVVTPNGETHTLSAGDPRLEAARVSLGALGVITEILLRVAPAFILIGEVETLPIERVAEDLESIASSSEFVKVWWLPETRGAQVFRYLRTPGPATDVAFTRAVDTHFTNRFLFPAVLALARRFPSMTGPLNRAVAASYLERPAVPVRSDLAFNVPMPPIHRELEYAFGLGDASLALGELAALVKREKLRVNFPVEARFVREDRAWMSPAFGRATCQIGAYMSDSPDLGRFFGAFEALAQSRKARPHWGKEMAVDPGYVAEVYPRSRDFTSLAREWDPDGTLRNAFLDRALG